jgi:hypothetical protein
MSAWLLPVEQLRAWQDWAAALLEAQGLQPRYGKRGDEQARQILAQVVAAAVAVEAHACKWPRCK